jgi:hypothetical protein
MRSRPDIPASIPDHLRSLPVLAVSGDQSWGFLLDFRPNRDARTLRDAPRTRYLRALAEHLVTLDRAALTRYLPGFPSAWIVVQLVGRRYVRGSALGIFEVGPRYNLMPHFQIAIAYGEAMSPQVVAEQFALTFAHELAHVGDFAELSNGGVPADVDTTAMWCRWRDEQKSEGIIEWTAEDLAFGPLADVMDAHRAQAHLRAGVENFATPRCGFGGRRSLRQLSDGRSRV